MEICFVRTTYSFVFFWLTLHYFLFVSINLMNIFNWEVIFEK